jgi:hypothetical protein
MFAEGGVSNVLHDIARIRGAGQLVIITPSTLRGCKRMEVTTNFVERVLFVAMTITDRLTVRSEGEVSEDLSIVCAAETR